MGHGTLEEGRKPERQFVELSSVHYRAERGREAGWGTGP